MASNEPIKDSICPIIKAFLRIVFDPSTKISRFCELSCFTCLSRGFGVAPSKFGYVFFSQENREKI
jgi:hypothetical protein